ncbi:MAG: primosomal protein N' [Clostridia bacterium]|nr:primosomal protein N' [Clostridia bacterium]
MFCEVYLLDVPYHLDRPFDYECSGEAVVGAIVKVPFGKADKLRHGVIVKIKDTVGGDKIKPVHSSLDGRLRLTEQMCGLCLFLKEHTLCTFGEAVRCILPPGALSDKLNESFRRTVTLKKSREETAALLTLSGRAGIRSEGQRSILRYLIDIESADYELVRALPGVTPANIAALRDKGIVIVTESENIRNPYAAYAKERDTSEIILSRAQGEAYRTVEELYLDSHARCALLHGVTGSGKTKIILKAIDKCIADGKGVIMMVPEISLTPQTVSIFCKRYGERVAVIHSSLSAGERMDAWKRIKRGDVDLVIGTRSAVFAPLDNIGMIVIDEEHEHTYKSESDPKYHAREVASYICGKNNALLLLASATPALESYYKAKRGIYTLISLKERFGGVKLPDAIIVDMREELRLGNLSPISERLIKSLKEVYEREEQAILFLNRRGYNSQVSCKGCGDVVSCPRCSVSLTFHTSASGGKMLCHLCGYTAKVPKVCESCGSDNLSFLGYGTQKVEAEISKYLPEMSLMRMDADTTSGKLSYDKMLEDFRASKSDILLGTQMVAKGHDFPKVTLVGVVLADTSLFVSDFRASEKTFSLLTQVIGRAGRSKEGGIAVIQTYSPKNEIIRLACLQDYEKFYEGEIELRRELTYPPFCDLVTLTVTAEDEREVMKESKRLSDTLKDKLSGEVGKLPFLVFGPFEASVYRVNEKYRMKMVVKCRLNNESRAMFSEILSEFSKSSRLATLSIDFNPMTV